MFSDDYLDDGWQRRCTNFGPNLVGLSLRNLSNHSYLDPQWALPITKNVIDKIRESSTAPIVCGGPAFSLLPEECFAYLEPRPGPGRRCRRDLRGTGRPHRNWRTFLPRLARAGVPG